MRLHSLEITAFGPFADPVRVDFDDLSAANVFLLCGDTGAGKSTVLDAVCFALYGDVPSDRGAARQLRSQHAADGVAPRVVLETTVTGRRLRFTRSPGWLRPKKRGTGLTTQQPTVLVEERVGDGWVAHTTRLDEAGHLVGDLLGMNLDQFSQVVLLPQGRFDTFLRSSSEERQRLLTLLFRTRRFEDVERWLADRRTTLRRESDTLRQGVETLLHRVSEAADAELPTWDDLSLAVVAGDVQGWLDELATSSAETASRAREMLDDAAHAMERAVDAHDAGRRLADLRIQHETAVRSLSRLAVETERAEADRARLDAARRALPVLPVAEVARRTTRAAAEARTHATSALGAVTDLLDPMAVPTQATPDDVDALATRAEAASVRAALVAEFVPRARELERVTADLAGIEARVADAEQQRATTVAWLDAAPTTTAELDAEVERLSAAGEASGWQADVTRLAKRLSQFAVADELAFQVGDAERRRDEQRGVVLDLREQLHDLRERRLAGMAAELADQMVVGADCPVCGSANHPHPAIARSDAPTRDDEQVVRKLIDDAEIGLATLDDTVRSYRDRLATVRGELGDATVDDTAAALGEARSGLTTALQAAADLPDARAALADWEQQVERRRTDLAALDVGLAADRAATTSTRERIDALTDALTALVGGPGTGSGSRTDARALAELADASGRAARLLAAARDALSGRITAERAEQDAADLLSVTARDHGFADPAAADAATLTSVEIDRLVARLDEHDRARAEAERVLATPDVAAAAGGDPPDLASLAAEHERSTGEHGDAVAAVRLARGRADRVATRSADVARALSAWEPVRAEHARVRAISELAEGRGPDNPRQVRLSAYVLAARLSEVVEAANERLVGMYDDRFLLEHTADRGVGERRGGLSLVVRDQWTDEVRDPVTLSGGETFVVSLALALGLADVVTAEAGGTPIDTLFVDEGFGSLDADTLELVMDTLDQLRDGGRVVGLVSHVAEMRSRIPAQLQVTKGRHGSTIDQSVTTGG